ncbi:unnamed protein product, partial [Iphiclides podalirius]
MYKRAHEGGRKPPRPPLTPSRAADGARALAAFSHGPRTAQAPNAGDSAMVRATFAPVHAITKQLGQTYPNALPGIPVNYSRETPRQLPIVGLVVVTSAEFSSVMWRTLANRLLE